MGVINRTPNSFSDHGASLNPDFFKNQMLTFLSDPTVIVDVGFESTAPMNTAITGELELERFHEFLEASKEFSFKDRFISFDTYRPESFALMAREFKKIHPDALLIFNDVSGVLDEELKVVLEEFRGNDFYYIYTFSHIPSRSLVLDHMKFVNSEADIIQEVSTAFIKAFSWFKDFQMETQVIFDPGFGFSKSFDQNWTLINSYSEFNNALLKNGFNSPILIGLSKKSFLKKALGHGGEVDPEQLNRLHHDCLIKIREASTMQLLFRVHDLKAL